MDSWDSTAQKQFRDGFRIAIVCAKSKEADMVERVLDQSYPDCGKTDLDGNVYSTGRLGRHDIVIVYMGENGGNYATQVAIQLPLSFPNITTVLIVGVCGVIPHYIKEGDPTPTEIVLGDCVISTRVIEYGVRRQTPDYRTAELDSKTIGHAGHEILGFMNMMKTHRQTEALTARMRDVLAEMIQNHADIVYPGTGKDLLFAANCRHRHPSQEHRIACQSCRGRDTICKEECSVIGCPMNHLVLRQRHQTGAQPEIHFGDVGSSNVVMRSGTDRDELAARLKLIAFEMEGFGMWDKYKIIVVKSACDYADSHKNKSWQSWASATAASTLKALLEHLPTSDELNSPSQRTIGHPSRSTTLQSFIRAPQSPGHAQTGDQFQPTTGQPRKAATFGPRSSVQQSQLTDDPHLMGTMPLRSRTLGTPTRAQNSPNYMQPLTQLQQMAEPHEIQAPPHHSWTHASLIEAQKSEAQRTKSYPDTVNQFQPRTGPTRPVLAPVESSRANPETLSPRLQQTPHGFLALRSNEPWRAPSETESSRSNQAFQGLFTFDLNESQRASSEAGSPQSSQASPGRYAHGPNELYVASSEIGSHQSDQMMQENSLLRYPTRIRDPDEIDEWFFDAQLGWVLDEQGKHNEAEGYYVQALKGREVLFGPYDERTTEIVNRLHEMYKRMNKNDKAAEMAARLARRWN